MGSLHLARPPPRRRLLPVPFCTANFQPELIAQEENEGFTLTLRLSPLPPPFRELQLQRCWSPFEEPKPWQQPRLPEKPWRGTISDGRHGIWEESLRLLRARGGA